MAKKKQPSSSARPRKPGSAKPKTTPDKSADDSLSAASGADTSSGAEAAEGTPETAGGGKAQTAKSAGKDKSATSKAGKATPEADKTPEGKTSAGKTPEDSSADTADDLPDDIKTTKTDTDSAPTDGADAGAQDQNDDGKAADEGSDTGAGDADTPAASAPGSARSQPLDDSAAPVPVPAAPAPETGGRFWPMVLGGFVAAAIGAAAAYVILPRLGVLKMADDSLRNELTQADAAQTDRIDAQAAEIDTLRDSVAALNEAGGTPTDLSGIEAAQGDQQSQLAALADRIDRLQSDIAALQDRPAGAVDGAPASQDALASLRQALTDQQAALDAQQEEIDALNAEAAEQAAEAQSAATAALRRAALTRIRTALDTGAGYAGALADLEATGQEAPEALQNAAADGVPSLADLRDSFPPAARAALAASRRALDDSGEGAGGVMGFLSDQLGARSLEPREGDDPDAVLSRAEFALQEARLGDALAEIETLPSEGRAEMAAWTEEARTRMNATRAADALGAELN